MDALQRISEFADISVYSTKASIANLSFSRADFSSIKGRRISMILKKISR
jgi:hypothetical protein